MLWLGLMLMVVGLCSSGALATTMGPPAAGLDAGQFGVGLGYSTSDIDIETKGKAVEQWKLVEVEDDGSTITTTTTTFAPEGGKFKLKNEIESDMIFANLGYGISDKLEVFLRLGMADETNIDSGNEFAYGLGAKATFYGEGDLKLGALFQMSWSSIDGDTDGEQERFVYGPWLPYVETVNTTDNWEVDYYQLKFAVGPTYKLMEAFLIYGGPFYHLMRGEFDIERSGETIDVYTIAGTTYTDTVTYSEKASGDIEEQSSFGAYIGVQVDLAENLPLCVEYQLTGDADILGASLVYRF